jgi:hypothetical protein
MSAILLTIYRDLTVLKYYKEGFELSGFEGVHQNLCKEGFLNGDLELTTKGRDFIKNYPDWDKVETFNNETYLKIKV